MDFQFPFDADLIAKSKTTVEEQLYLIPLIDFLGTCVVRARREGIYSIEQMLWTETMVFTCSPALYSHFKKTFWNVDNDGSDVLVLAKEQEIPLIEALLFYTTHHCLKKSKVLQRGDDVFDILHSLMCPELQDRESARALYERGKQS